MTQARTLIGRLKSAGVTLRLDGDAIVHRGPRSVLSPDVLAKLRQTKGEIVAELQRQAKIGSPALPGIVDGNGCERDEFDPGEATASSWPALADAWRARIETELAWLPQHCTPDGRRLLQVTRGFLASHWFNQAIALGWNTVELFGINADAERPLIGDWGLLVTVALVAPSGVKIVSVSQDCACYRTRSGAPVTWPRFRPAMADNVLWWECAAIVNTGN
jgi:hypothetical protein